MKKEIGVFMLLSAFWLSGCGAEKPGSIVQGADDSTVTKAARLSGQETEEQTALWFSENNEVKLSPIRISDKYGYEGVTVAIGSVKRTFDWNWSILEKPRVFYADVTGDGTEEAVIVFNKGRGTGLSIDELHVLNRVDLSEINVQNLEEIIAKQIETNVAQNGDRLAIQIKAAGKEYAFSYEAPNLDFNQDQLYFGGLVYHELKNNQIIAKIAGSVGAAPHYVCDFYIPYKFDATHNEFRVAEPIKVVPYDK